MKRLLATIIALVGVIGMTYAEGNHNAVTVTDSNFTTLIKQNKVVVVDFWAAWCGPCRAIAPMIEQVATEMKGKAVIGKCNVDENRLLTQQFGIRSIPTLIFFKNGKQVDLQIGALPKDALLKKINALLE